MAKLVGITGGLSGKMGSAVFRQSGGKTIASQYQPIVKNPNSDAQSAQRAKFKLMTQLAAIMSPGFGSFIIKTRPEKGKGTQRNAFMQTNFGLVTTVDSESEGITATIPMEKLQLTSSFRYLPQIEAISASGVTGIDLRMTQIDSNVTTLRVVVVGYRDTEVIGVSQPYIKMITDFPVNDGRLNASIETGTGKFTVLAYGLIPSETLRRKIDLDNIHTPADDDFISAVELNKMVDNGSMAETTTVGTNVSIE